MDLNSLPAEILDIIISYLNVEDAKEMSLTSKKMYSLTLSRIWSKPKFEDDKVYEIAFLQKISKFPILELHAKNFDCSWLEIAALVPHLKLLHLDITRGGKRFSPKESRLPYLKIPVTIYTNTFTLIENEHFDDLLEIIDTAPVKEMVIDHRSLYLPLERLKKLVGKVDVIQLSTNCVDLNSENVVDFVDIVTTFKNCKVTLEDGDFLSPHHKFAVSELELMVKQNIKVTSIDTDSLRTGNVGLNFLAFAEVIRKMKYLKELNVSDDNFAFDPPPVDYFKGLPIPVLATNDFKMDNEKLAQIANTLSEMKSLSRLIIVCSIYQEAFSKLSPEELALFRNLPVTDLDLLALDLKKDNIEEFSEVIKGMRVGNILYDERDFVDFKITIQEIWDGSDIYQTIKIE